MCFGSIRLRQASVETLISGLGEEFYNKAAKHQTNDAPHSIPGGTA